MDLVVVHLNHYLEVLERYSLIDPGSDPLWRLTFLINWEFQTSVILHLSIIHLFTTGYYKMNSHSPSWNLSDLSLGGILDDPVLHHLDTLV